MQFIHINIAFYQKLKKFAKITSASIIRISDSKLGETILASELVVDSNDLIKLDLSKRGGSVACFIKGLITQLQRQFLH